MTTVFPLEEDIVYRRGDTCPIPFTVTYAADGSLVPFAGFTFKMTVDTLKEPPDNTTKVFEVDGVSSGDGKVSFTPIASQTDILGTHYYDCQMIDGTGLIICTFAKAKIKFKQDITK